MTNTSSKTCGRSSALPGWGIFEQIEQTLGGLGFGLGIVLGGFLTRNFEALAQGIGTFILALMHVRFLAFVEVDDLAHDYHRIKVERRPVR